MAKKERTVTLPEDIYKKIAEEINDSDIQKISDFVINVLNEKLGLSSPGEEFSEEDEEKVKERLKALGYID